MCHQDTAHPQSPTRKHLLSNRFSWPFVPSETFRHSSSVRLVKNSQSNRVFCVLQGDDTDWVGAWWMGFLLCATLALLVSIPMLLFPKHLPNRHKRADDDAKPDFANFGAQLKGAEQNTTSIRPAPIQTNLEVRPPQSALSASFGQSGTKVCFPSLESAVETPPSILDPPDLFVML